MTLEQVTTIEKIKSRVFRLDVKDDVNLNIKVTFERNVSTSFVIKLCSYILSSIVCLENHNVLRKLSQGEQRRWF